MTHSQPESTKEENKVFHDPIHGHMEFDPILVKIIDTPQFQRLRNIKQLGGAYFVYPGASHNRFEHSLGVAHLAGQLVQNLKEKQPELGIDERDILCVEIAGLCHDLGHGPFSHMFDGMFIPKARPDLQWKHEEASVKMFEHIVKKLNEDGFDLLSELRKLNETNGGNDLEFIKEMINGPEKGHYKGRPSNKSFLYEIVSNKRNGLDVDKFDYFARDCYHLGIKNSFDHCRFLQFARVCEVDGQLQICTRDKELSNIYEMFHTRSCLHRKAYQHKTNKIIELMITEALIKADTILNISAAIDNMEAYSKLSDCIFEKILYSSGDNLKEAREILEKIVSRELYLYLGKTKMKEMPKVTEELKENWKEELAKTSVTTYQEEAVVELTKDDFEIIITAFDFGMKEKNPMENLHFYSKSDKTKAFKIPSAQVSQFLLPVNFSEKWINVYCRSSDKSNVAYRHFYQWCRDKDFLLPPSPSQSRAVGPEPKMFNDPIHGHMEFQPDLVKIIDTPQFQRLRFIKQLGGAYFVYPGASHNRFEHSLGVAHLAGQLVRRLQKKQPELGIDKRDVLCVEIAALCHDLGHGPFSEVFDQIFLKKVRSDEQNRRCERSEVSANLFKQIDEGLILDRLDMTFIEELINGIDTEERPNGRPTKRFLYDIVNNKRNGVDVNVFDSVARDCHRLGLKTQFDHQRFIKFAKVFTVEGKSQICIRDKMVSNVYDLFHTIASLHNKAYQHKVTMKIELMMSEIVKKTMTNEVTLQQALEVYSQMTDSRFGERDAENPVARNIWERIHSRNLYKYLDTIETEETQETCTAAELAEEIATKLAVRREDIGLYVSSMFPQNSSTETINGMNFYDKSGGIILGKEIDVKKPQISKPDISHKQRTYVFYKGTEQTVPTKERVETLKRTLRERRLSTESVSTSCVKFMKCSFY